MRHDTVCCRSCYITYNSIPLSSAIYGECIVKIWTCFVIVADADSKFKDIVLALVECLVIHVGVAATRSHKTIGVLHFYRFVNYS